MANGPDLDTPPIALGGATRNSDGKSGSGTSARSSTRVGGSGRGLPDAATLIGIGGALGLIITALVLGGSPGAFIDLPAMLVVLGGTLAVTLASFTLRDVGITFRVLTRGFAQPSRTARGAALQVLSIADFTRRHGVLKVKGQILGSLKGDPFLHKGLKMIVDGIAEDDVDHILARESEAEGERFARAVGVLRRAAEVAPAMGLIGTLIGLVQMLGSLDDPSAIGPGMAVALLTTFYGAVLGNVVFLPLAGKLERNALEEERVRRVYRIGVSSVASKDNPRRLEMLLDSVLPASARVGGGS